MVKKKTTKKKPIRLSPSSLNRFRRCPRCFWNHHHNPKLWNLLRDNSQYAIYSFLDRKQKEYYDKYRKSGPPLLKAYGMMSIRKIKLVDQKTADVVRKRIKWEDKETGAILNGMMDDCFVDKKGKLTVMDNKSTMSIKHLGSAYEDDYIFQLKIYAFILKMMGKDVNMERGFLVYYELDKERSKANNLIFTPLVASRNLKDSDESVEECVLRIFREAVNVLKNPKPPKINEDCSLCRFLVNLPKERTLDLKQYSKKRIPLNQKTSGQLMAKEIELWLKEDRKKKVKK